MRSIFYDPQVAYFKQFSRPGMMVLDAGCGPALVYPREAEWLVVGVELSYTSVCANTGLDGRVCGTVTRLPLRDQSIDATLCFCSLHHMVGGTISQNRRNVAKGFGELGRVLKPGGHLFVFELAPWSLFWLAEQVVWNAARLVLGRKFDMYFYSSSALINLAQSAVPSAKLETFNIKSAPGEWLPPVFSLQWLKIPRAIYPFEVRVYHWTL